MIIKELQLRRFGRHEALDCQTNAPVIGLSGENGVGKSTVMEAIKFAITGETTDNLDSYVKNCKGNGSVLVRFTKNGREGSIFRQIGSTAKRALEWDGKTIKGAKEVDAIMAEIFGADKKAIANAVFARGSCTSCSSARRMRSASCSSGW